MITLHNSLHLSKLLFLNDLYELILPIHGDILCIGTTSEVNRNDYMAILRWFSEIYEPTIYGKRRILVLPYDSGSLSCSNDLEAYCDEGPHASIALVYFNVVEYDDMKECLNLLVPFLTRGSVLAFSGMSRDDDIGQLMAVKEVFGFGGFSLQRWHFSINDCYIVI